MKHILRSTHFLSKFTAFEIMSKRGHYELIFELEYSAINRGL
jgi:hypothetical protein